MAEKTFVGFAPVPPRHEVREALEALERIAKEFREIQRQTCVTLVENGSLTPAARAQGYVSVADVMQNTKSANRSKE